MKNKPLLRLIHHLHRTGGTLISKCIASLPNIALLSEINPQANFKLLDPVFQANFWLKLISDSENEELSKLPFEKKISEIHDRAYRQNETLVIRNWAYLDFFGRPFTDNPSHQLSITSSLQEDFKINEVVTVRHPIDQWLSWCNYDGSVKAYFFSFDEFIDNCLLFQQRTSHLPFFRYEDFVEKPTRQMKKICKVLDLEFDEIFLERWPYYFQITGDDSSRAQIETTIEPHERKEVPFFLKEKARSNPNYYKLLDAYGYNDV